MFDSLVQSIQIVTRYIGKHVMFNVVVHVPIQKSNDGIESERSAAQSEISCVPFKSHVLCVVTKEEQKSTVKWPQTKNDRDKPVAINEREDRDAQVASKHDTSPQSGRSSEMWLVTWVAHIFPHRVPTEMTGRIMFCCNKDGLS